MWSPYSHTDGLKVAVVSEDAGVELSSVKVKGIDSEALSEKLGGASELNIGDLMVEAVKLDHSFDWQFVDADQGEAGLSSGEYYAAFVLPENFTSDFLSVFTGEVERPTIEYWVNEKYNAVALEVTDAGAGVVGAVVNRVFSAVVADALSGIVKDIASDILEAGTSASSATSTGLDGAKRDLNNVKTNLGHVGESLDRWRATAKGATSTLDALKKSAPALRDAVSDAKKLLSDARTSVHEVNNAYSSALSQGGSELSSTLKSVAESVQKAVSSISTKQEDVDAALKKAKTALEEGERLIEALKKADPNSSTLANLEKQNEKAREEVEALEKASRAVVDAAGKADDAASSLAKDVSKTVDNMKKRNSTFNSETLPKIDTSLDALAIVMGSLDGALGSLDAQIAQAKTLLEQLDGVLSTAKDALDSTDESLDTALHSIDSARSDLAALANARSTKKLAEIANIDEKSYGSFMASPVSIEVTQVYALNSFGTGVAPFYTNLALWVGCFMLVALIKLEVDPRLFPRMRPWQGNVGRLMLFGALALLQSVVVAVGDLIIGVQTVNPIALVVASLFTSFCFVNIVYALAITFKHVGKALAVVVLIVQIPGASGIYPIQLMPGFFQAMYPWLPFTYGMGAMREAIGGFYGVTYAQCLAWLLACGLATLALALIVRPRLLNLNRLFDRKLEQADVFIAEEHGMGTGVIVERPVLDSLLETREGRERVAERAATFAQRYRLVQQSAPIAVVALLVCLGVVSILLNLDADGKLVALMVLIAGFVLVFGVCITFEFVNDNLAATALLTSGASDAASSRAAGDPLFFDVLWQDDEEAGDGEFDEGEPDSDEFVEPVPEVDGLEELEPQPESELRPQQESESGKLDNEELSEDDLGSAAPSEDAPDFTIEGERQSGEAADE